MIPMEAIQILPHLRRTALHRNHVVRPWKGLYDSSPNIVRRAIQMMKMQTKTST